MVSVFFSSQGLASNTYGFDVTSDYTITSGKNGFSVGPMTIASGVTVTVPSGQRWVILWHVRLMPIQLMD